ncbi:MAG: ATP-binding cassette domain-containing protein [Amylibacter sp.]|nr:ATP-binding cassette domain-containing protein [Amylibacter sp.]
MSIAFDNLTLRYEGFHLTANFVLEPQKKYAILGPSGCGKSTLLAAIAGFMDIDQGRILLDGLDITNLPPAQRPVSLLFQDHNLFPHMTVMNNVALGLKPDLKLTAKDTTAVHQALKYVDLTDQAIKFPSELSGGQQQRVAIARALLRDKPLMLLDEPFAALGPALKHEMLDIVAQIVDRAHSTLVLVTHDPKDALYIADETIFIANGKAYPPINTKALFENPPQALQDYLGETSAKPISLNNL